MGLFLSFSYLCLCLCRGCFHLCLCSSKNQTKSIFCFNPLYKRTQFQASFKSINTPMLRGRFQERICGCVSRLITKSEKLNFTKQNKKNQPIKGKHLHSFWIRNTEKMLTEWLRSQIENISTNRII